MNILIKFAWRNVWRNRSRTALLLASMTVGLVGILLAMGFVRGWIDSMRDAAVNTFAGHVKIMGPGFFRNPSIDRTFTVTEALAAELSALPREVKPARRLALEGLLSTARHARIVRLVGIDPEAEAQVSIIAASMVEGRFLQAEGEGAVLIGKTLADRLNLKVGKKVVLTVAQSGGEIAAAASWVAGIFETGQVGFDEGMVYLRIDEAAELFHAEDRVSEVVLMLPDIGQSEGVADQLRAGPGTEGLEVLAWTDRLTLVTESMRYVDQTMFIYYFVFFSAMAFGIVNTLLMSIGERTREIGMMMALGMQRAGVIWMILAESLFIGLLAVACGLLLGSGILTYYGQRGIDLSGLAQGADYAGMGRMLYPDVLPGDLFTGAWITLLISMFFSLYPAWRASRLLPVTALRQT